MKTNRTSSIKKWVIFLVLFPLIVLVILEGYFRFFAPIGLFENHTTSSFGIHTAFRPNLDIKPLFGEFPFHIETDSNQLRNFRQSVYKKPKDTFRILCLGGSIFAASGVNNDETFAYYLEKTLKQQFPEKKIEVINTAKNSWEIAEFYTYIKNEGYKFSPDLVISYFHTGELSTMDFSKLEADAVHIKRTAQHVVEIEIRGIDFNIPLNNLSAFNLNLIQGIPFYDTLFRQSHLLRAIEDKVRKNLILKEPHSSESNKVNLQTSIESWEIGPSDIIHWKTDYGEIKNTNSGQVESTLYSIALEKYYELLRSINSDLSFLIIPSPQEILKLQIYPNTLIPIKVNPQSDFSLINLLEPLTSFQNANPFPLNYPKVIHWTPAGHNTATKLVYNQILPKVFPKEDNTHKKKLSLEAPGLVESIHKSNDRVSTRLVNTGHSSFIKGIISLNQNKLNEAEKHLKQSLEYAPKDKNIIWRLANLYSQIGNFQKSLNFIEKARKNSFPLTDEVYGLKAKNFFMLKDYEKADAFFSKSISLSPANALNHFNFAKFLLLQNRFKEAIIEFKKADHYYPNDIKTLLALGTTYFVTGDKAQAIRTFEKALKIDPLNPNIQKTLTGLNIKIQKKHP